MKRVDAVVIGGGAAATDAYEAGCGNCSRVHPMVEAVVTEGKLAGVTAWKQIRGNL